LKIYVHLPRNLRKTACGSNATLEQQFGAPVQLLQNNETLMQEYVSKSVKILNLF
jgi:hypothetical protein